jgi:hypothetical protein
VAVDDVPRFDSVHYIFKKVFIFPQNLREAVILLHVVLEYRVNLGAQAVGLKILCPIDVAHIAIELNLFFWTHLLEELVHLVIFVKPVPDFEWLEFVSDFIEFLHKFVQFLNILPCFVVAYEWDRMVKEHGPSWHKLG